MSGSFILSTILGFVLIVSGTIGMMSKFAKRKDIEETLIIIYCCIGSLLLIGFTFGFAVMMYFHLK